MRTRPLPRTCDGPRMPSTPPTTPAVKTSSPASSTKPTTSATDMARGRIIGQNLGDSEKIEALANDTHRFAYVLLVSYADSEGRFIADSVSLNGKLYTRCGWTPKIVEAALEAMHAVNLIVLYENGRKRYGVIVDFHKHNTIRLKDDGEPRDEAPSRLPAPPSPDPAGDPILPNRKPRSSLPAYAWRKRAGDEKDASTPWEPTAHPGVTPESPGETLAGPGEVEVEVERKGNTTQEDLQPLSATPTRAHSNDAFLEAWNQHRGHLPSIRTLDAKRKRALDTLRKEHGAEALSLFRDATQCVAADPYWVQKQYGFTNLVVPGRVLEKAEKWRAGAIQLGDANLRMAAQVDRWSKALGVTDERPVN